MVPNRSLGNEEVESLAVGAPWKLGFGIGRVGESGVVELVFPEKGAGGSSVDFVGGNVFGVVECFEAGLLGSVGSI